MTAPRIVGLFEGYGGLTLGVSAVTGGALTAYAEIDDAMCRVLAHHHPGVPNLGDVSVVKWDAHRSLVDVMCGGFPCQDVSLAGLGRGLAHGTRSGLWYQFARAIAETRPPLVVIENVRGLLSAPASWRADGEAAAVLEGDDEAYTFPDDGVQLRAMGAVLGDLANLGYGAEWIGLRAADVGAPHGRFRVFIVAYPLDAAEVRDPARRPFAAWSPARGVWESGDGDIDLFADAADVYGQTWPASGSMIEGVAYERPADAPSLSESVRALLPTPIVTDGTGGSKNVEASEFSPQMRDIDKLLPTPTGENASGGNGRNGRGEPLLPGAVHDLLPTPRAAEPKQSMVAPGAARRVAKGEGSLTETIGVQSGENANALLPTPRASDGPGASAHNRTWSKTDRSLHTVVHMGEIGADLLPTPTTAYATGGNAVRGGDRGDEQLLPGIARDVDAGVLLPTPTVVDLGNNKTPEEWDEWRGKMQAQHGNGNGHGPSLSIEAIRVESGELLPTPDAYSGTRGGGADPEVRRAGGHSVSLGDVIEHGARDGELASRWGKYAPRIALWEHVHGHPAPEPTVAAPKGGRRLSPYLTEWMMGLKPGHLNDPAIGLNRNESLRGAGNGVVPRQAAVAVATLLRRFTRPPELERAAPARPIRRGGRTMGTDRTVHCTIVPVGGGRIEIVRYDRGGKWYREDNGRRERITLDEAVKAAAADRPAVIWHEGLPGGGMFDSRVRKARGVPTSPISRKDDAHE